MGQRWSKCVQQPTLTDNFVFQSLIFSDRLSVTFTLVFFASEIFNRLIVEQAIGMNTAGSL